MQERLLVVYYGIDRLPYKDENREVHYPIVNSQSGGTLITGENNTSKLYFYTGLIGGGARQWIANIKKPDGTLSYQLCTNGQSVELENGENDYRVELDISGLFADQVGDVFIGLQGYSGDTVIVEDDGTYEISGDPIVLATGTIKIKVNYAPSVLAKGETITPTTEQQIMAALGGKMDTSSGIFVVANIQSDSFDYSGFEDGQVYFDLATKQFYRLESNLIVRAPLELQYATINGTLLTTLLSQKANDSEVVHLVGTETISGTKIFAHIYKGSATTDNEYITAGEVDTKITQALGGVIYRFKGSVATYDDLPSTNLTAGDVYNVEDTGVNYAWTGTTWDSLGASVDMSNYYTKSETYSQAETNSLLGGKVDKSSSSDKVYATAHDGTQTTLSVDYGSTFSGNVVRRDSNSQVYVPLTPTANGQATSKKYVDDQDSAIMEVAEGRCKTYIISYAQTNLTETYFTNGGKVYKTNGDEISTWSAFQTYVQNQDCGNSFFNSQNNDIAIVQEYVLTTTNIVILPDDENIKNGDIILVVETDVPDRWIALGTHMYYAYKMETTKVDLTNYVTTNTDQTISGLKTFGATEYSASSAPGSYRVGSTDNSTFAIYYYYSGVSTVALKIDYNGYVFTNHIRPLNNNYYDLGSSSYKYKDLYLSNSIIFKQESASNYWKIVADSSNNLIFQHSNNGSIYNNDFWFASGGNAYVKSLIPISNNASDLGTSSNKWKDIWGNSLKGLATLTQAQYDALVSGGTVDSDTFYFIEE